MTTYNRTITLASTADTITQNFSNSDSIVVTVNADQYSAGATASITIQSGESGDVAVSSSTVSIGSSFTITGISAGTYRIYLFYYDKYYGTQQGWVQGTFSVAAVSVSVLYSSTDANSSGQRIRSGYWQTTGGTRSHICGWNVGQAGLVHKWYRGATLLRTLTVSTSGTQQLPIADSSATNGTDVQYTLRIFNGTVEVGSVNYNVIYCLPPHTTASANSGDLTVPQGVTDHIVGINGELSVRTAYRITPASTDDGGTLGDDTVAAVVNSLGYATGFNRASGSDGATTPYSSSNNNIQVSDSDLPAATGGSTKSYRIWSYRYRTTNGAVGGPENYGENKYYDFDRTFTLTRASVTSITNFNPALSVYTEGSGTQTVTFSFSISNANQSTYYWQIIRVSGIEEGEFSATTGSVSASSPSFSTTITNNSTDETGSQGETFYARLYTDSGRTQQIGPDSGQFTLYDNDLAFAIGTISPSSTISATYGYPDPVTVQVTNNGQSGLQPNSRIWNITKGIVAYNIADLPNPGLTETYTLNLSNNNALPNVGTSNTYRLEVWNGQQLLSGPQFTITRSAADTTPDAFELGGPLENVGTNTDVFSNIITVLGINAPASISVGGTGSPAYYINGVLSSSSTVVNGNQVQLRVTSSGSSSTAVTGTLNIGGVTDSFTVTTATGGGTGSGIDSGPADYGIEIRGPDGVTKVLSPTTRYGCAMGQWVTFTLTASGTAEDSYLVPADMTGLTVANSTLLIITNTVTIVFTITRLSNGFLVENTTNSPFTLKAVPIRF